MGKRSNISDAEFLKILRENAGIYSRTARAINKQFGTKFSRQTIRQRALNFTEEELDIQEENLDVAEEGLHTLMRHSNPRIRLKAIDLFLKAKGRFRGYGDRVDLTSGDKPLEPFKGILPIHEPEGEGD